MLLSNLVTVFWFSEVTGFLTNQVSLIRVRGYCKMNLVNTARLYIEKANLMAMYCKLVKVQTQ